MSAGINRNCMNKSYLFILAQSFGYGKEYI
jgi:hypothetical protein